MRRKSGDARRISNARFPQLVPIREAYPDGDVLDRARLEIYAGGIVAYPTETFFGLGVNALDSKAVEKLFALKGRDRKKAMPMLLPSRNSLDQWARKVTPLARRLMEAFWPGPLTLLLAARPGLPAPLIGQDGTLGVRETRLRWVQDWVAACGTLITSTSANRSGRSPATRGAQVAREFGLGVDLVLDAAGCTLRAPSTVVDARQKRPVIVREGAIARKDILEAAQ
ncbi:MAG: threonylcarbamoyl-AMP synthase [Nitrospirae bacterium]|nr:threonylcarbamoyl-AMP synthase [Nitrospirota bacterium]